MNKTKCVKYIFLLLIIMIVQLLQKFNTIEQFKINYNVEKTEADINNISTAITSNLTKIGENLDSISVLF